MCVGEVVVGEMMEEVVVGGEEMLLPLPTPATPATRDARAHR